MESDWLSLSIKTWFSASKLLFSSCRAATWRKGSVEEKAKEWDTRNHEWNERNGIRNDEKWDSVEKRKINGNTKGVEMIDWRDFKHMKRRDAEGKQVRDDL